MAAPARLMETSRITSSPPNSLEGSLGAARTGDAGQPASHTLHSVTAGPQYPGTAGHLEEELPSLLPTIPFPSSRNP